jgi:glyoxylase-like metal-dependent hydrolase (beta-lactamase superfamily II)
MINPFNHLPDAVDTVAVFYDHWYQWGDVHQRIYWDNWQTVHGIRYPTNEVEERNGTLWESRQVLDVDLNPAIDAAALKMDAGIAQKGLQSPGWEAPFKAPEGIALAPGITLFPGSWNATVVKQDDGIVLLEAPLSGTYMAGVIDKAKQQSADKPLKAVLSTSDSWPHVGGVRQAVALGLPVYILDLNKPLLERLVGSPRRLHPDLLAQSPRPPVWRIVSQKVRVGTGANRMELYPLRGASTERQYMVYFPEHRLLYASDTLALNADGSLYAPELMREVMDAVQREHLAVTTVFAMHQGPVPWAQVTALVEKALN